MAAMSLASANALQLTARPVAAARSARVARAASASAKPVVGLGGIRLGRQLRNNNNGAARVAAARPTASRGSSSAFRVSAMADEAAEKEEEKTEKGEGIRQLLGVRGGSKTDDIWKIRLQLTKPVTWVPLIWGVMCGAAASGHYTWTPDNVGKALLCMFMSGPLLTGKARNFTHRSRGGSIRQ